MNVISSIGTELDSTRRLFLYDKDAIMEYIIYDIDADKSYNHIDTLPLAGNYSIVHWSDNKLLVCLIPAEVQNIIKTYKFKCKNLDYKDIIGLHIFNIPFIDVNIVFEDKFTDKGSIYEIYNDVKQNFVLVSNNSIEPYKYKYFRFKKRNKED